MKLAKCTAPWNYGTSATVWRRPTHRQSTESKVCPVQAKCITSAINDV